jgi:VanZ family protein
MFRHPLIWRLAATLWACQIYWMSSSSKLTSDQTRSYLAILLERWFGLHPAESTVRLIGVVIRKSVHVAEYAVLAFLVFRALEGIFATGRRREAWCFAITALYAVSDELHQMFVPGRGASMVDWGIDLAGVLLAIALMHAYEGAARQVTAQ